jgi:hypothetical protein
VPVDLRQETGPRPRRVVHHQAPSRPEGALDLAGVDGQIGKSERIELTIYALDPSRTESACANRTDEKLS